MKIIIIIILESIPLVTPLITIQLMLEKDAVQSSASIRNGEADNLARKGIEILPKPAIERKVNYIEGKFKIPSVIKEMLWIRKS